MLLHSAPPLHLYRGNTYTLFGTKFSRVSQGAAYGDDYQSATNYALVRLTNSNTGRVTYCRTHNPSSYAVQSAAAQSTRFDVPAALPPALVPGFPEDFTMEVVTNGIPS